LKPKRTLTAFIVMLLCATSAAQDSSKLVTSFNLSEKLYSGLSKKAASIEAKLDKKTATYLATLQANEKKLKEKLWKKDSTLAKQLFSEIDENYKRLLKAPQEVNKYSSVYLGHLDTLSTSLNFLNNNDLIKRPELKKVLDQYKELQLKLDQSERIKAYLKERSNFLKEQFQGIGMLNELKQFQRQAYYYSAQIKEYKELFENPSKLEAKLIQVVQGVPQFKEFFAYNSMLGAMFPLEGSSSYGMIPIQGLQTRAMVGQSLASRFGSGQAAVNLLQQNMKSAQAELESVKNKLLSFSSGSFGNSSDFEIPEGFKPNNQKTKSFLKRLEYGANIQSQKGSYYFPVTSDLGLSLGYKLNDKSVIGLGASYKIGWGKSWKNINLTNEGLGLRSYVDMKLKGTIYISGGYEQNYRSSFASIQQLKDYSSWQSSGLIGLSKKYKLSKKLKGDMKLLWDFLSYRQIPKTQAILFRIGYSLK
jgi:hypothetical protein